MTNFFEKISDFFWVVKVMVCHPRLMIATARYKDDEEKLREFLDEYFKDY